MKSIELSSIKRDPSRTGGGAAFLPKFLIIEKNAEIEALLKSRYPAQICIDTLPIPDLNAGETNYDVLVWNADSSLSYKSTGFEMLERVSRLSPETQIIVISHEEGNPAACRIKSENYHYIARP